MKKTLIFILMTSFFLTGGQFIKPQSKAGDLPVIDFSKDYPKKETTMQEIEKTEYVALETSDDILLGKNSKLSYVSDKYIVIHEFMLGDVFVFDRSGKLYSHFNHRGPGNQEYSWIKAGTIFDEKNEEIFVCSQAIQVYSLTGEYKRTLKVNTIEKELSVFNFDDESLLIYSNVFIESYREDKDKNNPYYLISKKDGSRISVLDIHLPKRYATRNSKAILFFPSNMIYGPDFVIADISSDTLFLLTQDKKLTPLLTRKPSVHASEPRKIWTPFLMTDKYIEIGVLTLEINGKGGKIPTYRYEFETGEITQITSQKGWTRIVSYASPAIAKNTTASLVHTWSIIEAYKMKRLKGVSESFVNSLSDDDNPVVRITKYK